MNPSREIVTELRSFQSVQTMPSKPYFSRSSPVITGLLKLKPTSSNCVPMGIP
jgi:hypothetical protein